MIKKSGRPKKQLGQVFLKEKSILNLIAESLDLKAGENVLEIGAGEGNLTEFVLEKVKEARLFAIEKDRELILLLKEKFKSQKNLEILSADIRGINLENFLRENKIEKIVGNIPYYLSGWLLRSILDLKSYPKIIVLVIQKEVGEKISSEEGNFFSLAFSLVSKVEKVRVIKAGSFYPRPKVDSALVKFSFFSKQENYSFRAGFFRFLKISFRQPRKTLFSNLERGGFSKIDLMSALENSGLDLRIRPHQLSLEAWLKLFRILEGEKSDRKKEGLI